MENHRTLTALHDKRLDGFKIALKEVKMLRLSGWRGFKLHLEEAQGLLSSDPVIKGIYSTAGKDGVKPWMDLDYIEELDFVGEGKKEERIILSQRSLNQKLFDILGSIIPPGGHLMVSYEGEQKIHSDTRKSLSLQIPPAVTPLGFLIFKAGFQLVKDWYLAEGGFEGPRKLWGEKAPDKKWEKAFLERTEQQISQFVEKKSRPVYEYIVDAAIKRAEVIIEIIKGNP